MLVLYVVVVLSRVLVYHARACTLFKPKAPDVCVLFLVTLGVPPHQSQSSAFSCPLPARVFVFECVGILCVGIPSSKSTLYGVCFASIYTNTHRKNKRSTDIHSNTFS